MANPHENQWSSLSSSVVVVMVPYVAQSHMNLLLQFSNVVSSYDIPVHYVGSALNNSHVKSRASDPLQDLAKIHFHDFQIPISPDISPSNTTTSSSKTTNSELQVRRTEATKHLREPVAALLRSLSQTARRLVVVYDSFMASVVQDVVSLRNAEAYSFLSISVIAGLAFTSEALEQNDNSIVPTKDLPSMEVCFPSAVVGNFVASQLRLSHFKAGELNNSCRAIEGSFIDQISSISSKMKRWAVGPLHQMTTYKELIKDQDKWLFEWLDQQEPNNVLYISFGTIFTLSDEDINEIALGLEQSGVKFIWVLRGHADKVNSLSNEGRGPQLPDGFEERMRGMGLVVREWVPQVKILEHPSTGGFMSHCGWNSCMESISMGVPLAAWPLQVDQPLNALLITEVLKVGVAVREWWQRDELVTSSMISRAVRKLMASEGGEEMRKRVAEIGEKVKRSAAEGGDCRLEWDSFIAHITR
ncbi:UDP-glucuronosyl/UDP-glucosyltransferase [Parasponia andersonii]|uniref:Glycosyltransferase n=1 Tax=Parasponia andersonii TaxID=3476 RepID=A0A2P5BYP5_PARAD|nr:UDP-glucuronosyl/UDP-glucosyltransferase [Parasponia andersonii]